MEVNLAKASEVLFSSDCAKGVAARKSPFLRQVSVFREQGAAKLPGRILSGTAVRHRSTRPLTNLTQHLPRAANRRIGESGIASGCRLSWPPRFAVAL